jgi:hypothetical protein
MRRTHKKSPRQPGSKNQRNAELVLELVRERANYQRLQRDDLRSQRLLEQLQAQMVTCRQHNIPILDYMVSLQPFGETAPALVAAPPWNALNAKRVLLTNRTIVL